MSREKPNLDDSLDAFTQPKKLRKVKSSQSIQVSKNSHTEEITHKFLEDQSSSSTLCKNERVFKEVGPFFDHTKNCSTLKELEKKSTCPICDKQVDNMSMHVESCCKDKFSYDKKSNSLGNIKHSTIICGIQYSGITADAKLIKREFCDVCEQEITHMTKQRRLKHIEWCKNKPLTGDKLETITNFPCPYCGDNFPTAEVLSTHLTRCSNKLNSQPKACVIADQERNLLKLSNTSKSKAPAKKRKRANIISEPKNADDAELQMAMALSASLAEERNSDNGTQDLDPAEYEDRNVERARFNSLFSPTSKKPRGRKKKDEKVYRLQFQNDDDRMRIVQKKVSELLESQLSYTKENINWSANVNAETCPLWVLSSLAEGKLSTDNFYVYNLIDKIEPRKIDDFYQPKHFRLSQVAGRQRMEASLLDLNHSVLPVIGTPRMSQNFHHTSNIEQNESLGGFCSQDNQNSNSLHLKSKLASDFANLVGKSDYSDAYISTKEGVIPVHCAVILVRCPQLLNGFSNDQNELSLLDFNRVVVRNFLEYIYTNECFTNDSDLNETNLLSVKELAIRYKIADMVDYLGVKEGELKDLMEEEENIAFQQVDVTLSNIVHSIWEEPPKCNAPVAAGSFKPNLSQQNVISNPILDCDIVLSISHFISQDSSQDKICTDKDDNFEQMAMEEEDAKNNASEMLLDDMTLFARADTCLEQLVSPETSGLENETISNEERHETSAERVGACDDSFVEESSENSKKILDEKQDVGENNCDNDLKSRPTLNCTELGQDKCENIVTSASPPRRKISFKDRLKEGLYCEEPDSPFSDHLVTPPKQSPKRKSALSSPTRKIVLSPGSSGVWLSKTSPKSARKLTPPVPAQTSDQVETLSDVFVDLPEVKNVIKERMSSPDIFADDYMDELDTQSPNKITTSQNDEIPIFSILKNRVQMTSNIAKNTCEILSSPETPIALPLAERIRVRVLSSVDEFDANIRKINSTCSQQILSEVIDRESHEKQQVDLNESNGSLPEVNNFADFSQRNFTNDDDYVSNTPKITVSKKSRITKLSRKRISLSQPAFIGNKKNAISRNNKNLTPVTPMPNYKGMVTPELKEALKRIGVKPLPRSKATKLLTHVYDSTHPYEDEPMSSTMPPPEMFKSPKKARTNDVLDNSSSSEFSSSQESNISSSGNEMIEESIMEESDFIQRDTKLKIKNFITADLELHRQILCYQPILLEELHVNLKNNGIKLKLPTLMDYLDEECVTFTMPRSEKQRQKQNQRSQRFKKRMLSQLKK